MLNPLPPTITNPIYTNTTNLHTTTTPLFYSVPHATRHTLLRSRWNANLSLLQSS
jgi:hypothetical protein